MTSGSNTARRSANNTLSLPSYDEFRLSRVRSPPPSYQSIVNTIEHHTGLLPGKTATNGDQSGTTHSTPHPRSTAQQPTIAPCSRCSSARRRPPTGVQISNSTTSVRSTANAMLRNEQNTHNHPSLVDILASDADPVQHTTRPPPVPCCLPPVTRVEQDEHGCFSVCDPPITQPSRVVEVEHELHVRIPRSPPSETTIRPQMACYSHLSSSTTTQPSESTPSTTPGNRAPNAGDDTRRKHGSQQRVDPDIPRPESAPRGSDSQEGSGWDRVVTIGLVAFGVLAWRRFW